VSVFQIQKPPAATEFNYAAMYNDNPQLRKEENIPMFRKPLHIWLQPPWGRKQLQLSRCTETT